MRAIGYIRVSTEDQGREGVSLAAQRQKIEQYCALHGLELAEVFSDERSAKDTNRPAFKGMMAALDERRAEALVVFKLDRLFRNTRDALDHLNSLKDAGVRFHSICEQVDTQSATGMFVVTIMAALAQMERGLISERTKEALRYKRTQGEPCGPDPYGWRTQGGVLVRDEGEQAHIAAMRGMYAATHSYRAVAAELNRRGVPSPRAGMRFGKREKTTGYWYGNTVKIILEGEA